MTTLRLNAPHHCNSVAPLQLTTASLVAIPLLDLILSEALSWFVSLVNYIHVCACANTHIPMCVCASVCATYT